MTYDWRTDSLHSWQLAIRLKALAIGAIRFETLPEMYWCEQHGCVP